MEHLAAAFLVDAKWFFLETGPDWVWKDLVAPTLTSGLLIRDGDSETINSMLRRAASTAKAMHRLQNMEIWNSGAGHACVFRYQQKNWKANLTWRGNWELTLEPDVIRAWEDVAKQRPLRVFDATTEIMGENVVIKWHGDAIKALDFCHQLRVPLRQCKPI